MKSWSSGCLKVSTYTSQKQQQTFTSVCSLHVQSTPWPCRLRKGMELKHLCKNIYSYWRQIHKVNHNITTVCNYCGTLDPSAMLSAAPCQRGQCQHTSTLLVSYIYYLYILSYTHWQWMGVYPSNLWDIRICALCHHGSLFHPSGYFSLFLIHHLSLQHFSSAPLTSWLCSLFSFIQTL